MLPLLRSKFAAPQDLFVVGFNWWHRKKPMWVGTYNVALHMLGRDYKVCVDVCLGGEGEWSQAGGGASVDTSATC